MKIMYSIYSSLLFVQTGRPAMQLFDRYSVRTYEGGRGVTALLGPEEASSASDRPGAPPQIVRDAVKVRVPAPMDPASCSPQSVLTVVTGRVFEAGSKYTTNRVITRNDEH